MGHTKDQLQGESYRYPLLSFSTSLQKRMPHRIQTAATAQRARLYSGNNNRNFARHALSRYCCSRGKTNHKRTPRFQHPVSLYYLDRPFKHLSDWVQRGMRLCFTCSVSFSFASFLMRNLLAPCSPVRNLSIPTPSPFPTYICRNLEHHHALDAFCWHVSRARVTYSLCNRIP